MPTYEITKDGQTFQVDVKPGEDPNAALAQYTGGGLAQDVAPERTFGESVKRGVGLAVRNVGFAPARLAAGTADIAATIGNIVPAGVDKAREALGLEPFGARIPTDTSAQLNERLSRFLPEPETFGERVVEVGGDVALTGGVGGAALAPKVARAGEQVVAAAAPGKIQRALRIKPQPTTAVAPAVARSEVARVATPGAGTPGKARLLADDIGQFFAKSPGKATALEGTGGAGAKIADELAAEADASPAGRLAANVTGGVLGTVLPSAAVGTSRRLATGMSNFLDDVLSGEVRAARTLQEAAADPAAAARAAADAPEGVLPARATEDPNLQAIEAKVLADDPAAALKAKTDLIEAEERSVVEIAEQFGPTSNPKDFQQAVVQQGAPEGVIITSAEPDEMVAQAVKGFNKAYDDAKGIPISTQMVNVEGGNIPLREALAQGVEDAGVLTDPRIVERAMGRVERRITQMETKGKRVGGPDDAPIVEVMSDDILNLRHNVRLKASQLAKTGALNADAAEEAEVLNAMNQVLTELLESQLSGPAAAALRATDARYATFKTVEAAVVRSKEKGLTPEALRASVCARVSVGQVARGETGELGRLAETGRDVTKVLGKPDEASRLVRDMTPEQLQTAKADFNAAIAKKASPGAGKLKGDNYLKQITANEPTLKAAGFTDTEIGNMKRIGQELKLVQGKSPTAVDKLLDDNLQFVMRAVAALAGSKAGSRTLKFFGGAGAGGSLILTRLGSEQMTLTLRNMTTDQADTLLRRAAIPRTPEDEGLMAALLVKPTDTAKRKADAARTLNAFLLESAENVVEDE